LWHQETKKGIGWLRCPKVEAAGIEPASRDVSVEDLYVRSRMISTFAVSTPNRLGVGSEASQEQSLVPGVPNS
jgi:hypothetical protein